MLCSVWLAYQLFPISKNFSGSLMRYTHGASIIFVTVIHAINLVCLNLLDKADLLRQKGTDADRSLSSINDSLSLMFGLRGLNTPWQVKSVPSQPKFLINSGSSAIPRGRYLVRQVFFLLGSV